VSRRGLRLFSLSSVDMLEQHPSDSVNDSCCSWLPQLPFSVHPSVVLSTALHLRHRVSEPLCLPCCCCAVDQDALQACQPAAIPTLLHSLVPQLCLKLNLLSCCTSVFVCFQIKTGFRRASHLHTSPGCTYLVHQHGTSTPHVTHITVLPYFSIRLFRSRPASGAPASCALARCC
jgi:hypothetical protein